VILQARPYAFMEKKIEVVDEGPVIVVERAARRESSVLLTMD